MLFLLLDILILHSPLVVSSAVGLILQGNLYPSLVNLNLPMSR
jgi:hypothetical protein